MRHFLILLYITIIFCKLFLDYAPENKTIPCGYGFTAPSEIRCLYRLNQYNTIEGCRSLEHLQNCGMIVNLSLYNSTIQ